MPKAETAAPEVTPGENAASDNQPVAETGPFGTEEMQTEQPLKSVSKGILDRLGLPDEVAKQIGLETTTGEAEPAPEPEATEQPEAETPEEETQPEGKAQGRTDDKSKTWAPEIQAEFNRRVGKLTAQREEQKARAEKAEAEAAGLKSKLEQSQPVTVQASAGDPLADVENESQLEKVRREARLAVKWCRANKDGVVVKDAQGYDREITPDQVQQMHDNAEDMLQEFIPKKEKQLGQRVESDEIAREVYPKLFEKGGLPYQVAQAILQEVPGLASHPARNLFLGDYLTGLGIRLERQNAANGPDTKGKAPAPKKTPDNPNPLLRKIPPVAPHVARTTTAPARNGSKQVDDAMNEVVNTGGDPASLSSAYRAFRQAKNTDASNRRAPAPV
jgi:hypothetical protein